MTNIIAKLKEFNSLENFILEMNNYYYYFCDYGIGEFYRDAIQFERFQNKYPTFEKELTLEVTNVIENLKGMDQLPYEGLFESYKLMSDLVYLEDKHVIRDGKTDKFFLLR